MTGLERKAVFILSILVCAIWLISLSKLGRIFFQKKGGLIGKSICILGLLALTKGLTADNYMVSSLIQQSLLILFFFLIFRGNSWEKLGFATVLVSVWEFIWNGTDSILSICNIILSNNRFMPYERGNGYLISLLSFLISAACIQILFRRTKLAEGHFLQGGSKVLFSTSGLLLVLLDLCNFGITRGVAMVSHNGADYWSITHNEFLTHTEVIILSVLCTVICLSLLFSMNRLIGYSTADKLHKMEISRYKGILEQYQKQANVRHDLKNHIISLTALAEHAEWDKLKEYLLKLYKAGRIGEEEIETGNHVINAIINTKGQTAGQKNIKLDCNINITKPLMIDDYDLCIIWGNILDNAIKAAEASQEKYILVQAEIVKRNLIINVKNSVSPDMREMDFGIQNWGTGLKNVNNIVQKEHGIMDIEIKGAVFEISIMLPIVELPTDRT